MAGRPIYSYGVMLGLSFILGWYATTYFAGKAGFSKKVIMTTLFLAIVGALFGARLLFFLSNPDRPLTIRQFFAFQDGGLVAYGGYLGGIVFAYAYLFLAKQSFFAFSDHAAPQLGLGLGFTRVGCFLYGCDYGKPTDLFWGIKFPRWNFPDLAQYGLVKGSAAFDHHVKKCYQLLTGSGTFGGTNNNPGNLTTEMVAQCKALGAKVGAPVHYERLYNAMDSSFAVHPTQLIASLTGFLIFGFLLWFRPRRKFDGQVLLVFLAIYAVFRFGIEMMRDDLQRGSVGVLSTSQFISLAVLVATGVLWFFLRKRPIREMSPEPAPPAAKEAPKHKRKRRK